MIAEKKDYVTYPVHPSELGRDAGVELQSIAEGKSRWMAKIAIAGWSLATVFGLVAGGVSYHAYEAARHQLVRFVVLTPTGRAETFLSSSFDFDPKRKEFRNSVRYYMRQWTEQWFSRVRTAQIGTLTPQARDEAYIFVSTAIGQDADAHRADITKLMRGVGQEFTVSAVPEIESMVATGPGAVKGTARIHMTNTYYSALTPTGTRKYVITIHFTVDPEYLEGLETVDSAKAAALERYNPLVFVVTSISDPEEE